MDAVQEHEKSASGDEHRWFDNRSFWGYLLDSDFVRRVFPGRVAVFTVLPKLLRLYFSLLDGEAQVERDLGLLRAYQTSGRGRSSDQLLDDLEMLKINGPKTVDQVRGHFSLQCVQLWRQVHGCIPRRRKITMRQPAAPTKGKAETFAAAKRAVLRASVRAKKLCSGAAKTAFGVTADFFQQPASAGSGVDEAWELGLKKFQTLTRAYALRNRLLEKGRAGFPKVCPRPSTPAQGRTSFSSIRLLAYLPSHDTTTCAAVPDGYEIRDGMHACKTADLVVLDDLQRLHDDDVNLVWVIHLLYIVARGLPLTTHKCALALSGDLRKLKPPFVRDHKPLFENRILFLVSKKLNSESPAVASALRAIEEIEGSAWRVEVCEDVGDSVPATAPFAARGAKQSGTRVPAMALATVAARMRLASRVAAKRQARPKTRGRPKKTQGEKIVPVPDLRAMWTWLQANRQIRNANCTRMFWRDHRPGPI